MTLSVAGRCWRTGQFGIAVATSSICVGARCVWLREGIGAVASQNLTNPALGKLGLDLLQEGVAPPEVLAKLLETDGDSARYRQLSILGVAGSPVVYSGCEVLDHRGEALGEDCVAAGNLLSGPDVAKSAAEAFEAASDEQLAERLLRGIEAGLAAGGEHGDFHSAALQVKASHVWPICDLRVDWDKADPIGRLRTLWTDYAPQMQDYIIRALDPAAAPSFGVPGNE